MGTSSSGWDSSSPSLPIVVAASAQRRQVADRALQGVTERSWLHRPPCGGDR